jgi:3-dehydroquinate dehydratase II
MHILIINGPNLNLLGTREPDIYGSMRFEDFFEMLKTRYPQFTLSYFQTNHEGDLIDQLQQTDCQGVIINAGAYTHTSIALHDALKSIRIPAVEVHISNIYKRETFRHHSYLKPVCKASIVGLGLEGYALGLEVLGFSLGNQ